MSSIEGIPEGWELVRVGHPVIEVDWVLNHYGDPILFSGNPNVNPGSNWPIIRKVKKPKQYRAFANAAEYLPHWGKPVAIDLGTGFDSVVSVSRTGVYIAVGTSVVLYTYREAFERLKFADGTPFGVEVAS